MIKMIKYKFSSMHGKSNHSLRLKYVTYYKKTGIVREAVVEFKKEMFLLPYTGIKK